ncbi:MAG TPA: hypothetical protein VFT66_15510 [Roseiflexaceae bacterium]|nr:hypothetical protein [Roseiflexaceae bacterium]
MSEERDERGRDKLGFVDQRCPYCHARLYVADEPTATPICLNACHLPHGVVRAANRLMALAAQRVQDNK